MARAPLTGFYFEPMTERLALIIESSPYPSDDPWAHVGGPVTMSPELARLEVATRWPGVDPETLEVEFPIAAAGETVGDSIARAHDGNGPPTSPRRPEKP